MKQHPIRNYFRRLAEGHENGFLAGFFSPILGAAAGCYGAGVRTIKGLYEKGVLKRYKLPFPVVSIGNLTWGGTGKTPLVEYLARKIGERNRNVLILTRGYSNDEVEQFRHHVPRALIGVGKDRIGAANKLAAQNKINLAILDDGLQHWPVFRDVEIVTVNALNPFGNRKLIPRGILREPLSALSRAQIIVISHSNLVSPAELSKLKDEIRKHSPKAHFVDAYLEPLFFYRGKKRARVPLERLAKQRVTTFSAVANPRSFQMLISRLGIKPVRNFEFGDHHTFSTKELQEIRQVSDLASAAEIITTEKDFYRSTDLISNTLNPLVLATRLRISSGEEILSERLFRLLGVNG